MSENALALLLPFDARILVPRNQTIYAVDTATAAAEAVQWAIEEKATLVGVVRIDPPPDTPPPPQMTDPVPPPQPLDERRANRRDCECFLCNPPDPAAA